MDIVTQAKNLATVLGTASALAYVSGYLALRTRAHALGTDPAFKLVDEAYVFAGFRFLFITLIVFLLTVPAVLVVRHVALWAARVLPVEIMQPVQWLVLVAVAIVTIVGFKILTVSGLLLDQSVLRAPGSALQGAVLGENTGLRLALTFASVVLAALTALWLQARISGASGPLELVLGLVLTVQIVMLPIYHGALFADRKVRVLAIAPKTVQQMTGPLGVVDRTSEHVTLLGLDAAGRGRLATVKLEDLNGIPVAEIALLERFVRELLPDRASGRASELADPAVGRPLKVANIANIANIWARTNGSQVMAAEQAGTERRFFAILRDYLNLTLGTIGSLGDSVVDSGELWIVELDSAGIASNRRRVGSGDDLAWPVVGPGGSTIYALRRGRLVRVSQDGESIEPADEDSRWVKLLGVTGDGTVLGLAKDGDDIVPAMRAPNGRAETSSIPLSGDDKAALARLMQETRSYAGGRTLWVERSARGGRGFDVFLKTGDNVVNVSDCGHDSCGQASLAPDFGLAVYIRRPRY